MKRKINKYDIVIYSCLLAAIAFLVLGGKDYFTTLDEETTVKDEFKSALKEINNTEEEDIPTDTNTGEPEPENLVNFDKFSIVQKYLDSILDQIVKDKLITYKMIKTWDEYSVLNMQYQKEVTDKYYEYVVDIKISNKNANLPTEENKDLSTDEYSVITLKFYIQDSYERNGFIVKKIDA